MSASALRPPLDIHTIRATVYIHEEHMAENGLRIRIDDNLRSEFIQMCRGNDQTAAQVLRAFMRQYIEAGKKHPHSKQLPARSTTGEQRQ